MKSERFLRSRTYRNSKTGDGFLPPVEYRIKDSNILRLIAVSEWKERILVLCQEDLLVGVDGLNIITEQIPLVSFA